MIALTDGMWRPKSLLPEQSIQPKSVGSNTLPKLAAGLSESFVNALAKAQKQPALVPVKTIKDVSNLYC